MIRRYDFGHPMQTGALIADLPAQTGDMPMLCAARGEAGLSFTCRIGPDDLIFGLGETVRGINKRGFLYRSWNSDDATHTEGKASLYASHNLLLFSGAAGVWGVYFDDPGRVTFDLGFTRGDTVTVTSENGDLSVYLLEGGSLTGLVREFRGIIGPSYLPPKWALGYLQSRWGYASETDIRRIVREHRERHIPLDGVCLDIDYMDNYKDFTWNRAAFPDMKGLNRQMRDEHIRLIPIIDAGVKQEEGYETCDQGVREGCFCKKENGDVFVGAVWPGRSYFPDFLNEKARTWFGDQYRVLLDAGFEGFWNDMNEPALFYTPESLENAYDEAKKLYGRNMGLEDAFRMKGLFLNLENNPEDSRRFYHRMDGKTVRHDKVHNLYGAFMTRAAAEGFGRYDGKKRYLLFSRSSFVGAHRYGGVWQGDNSAWWSHLLLNLKMLPTLNMTGFLYNGADLGGFGSDTTEDLLLRWLQLGVFTPLMRNHAAMQTRDQEIYRFANWADMRNTLTVRYALVTWLYSELMKAALRDGMLFRPLAFDYPEDETAIRVEDQVMLGEGCMIAPVYEQNARGRHVYLPEDMLMVRFRSAEDFDLEPLAKGHHWVTLQMNEFPLFIRKNHVAFLNPPAEWVEAVDGTRLTLLGWLDRDVTCELYSDDGREVHPDLAAHITVLTVTADGQAHGDGLTLDASLLRT